MAHTLHYFTFSPNSVAFRAHCVKLVELKISKLCASEMQLKASSFNYISLLRCFQRDRGLKFDFDMGVLFRTNDDAVVKIATTAGNSLGSKCKVNKTHSQLQLLVSTQVQGSKRHVVVGDDNAYVEHVCRKLQIHHTERCW